MRIMLLLAVLTVLVSCGADGEPVRPTASTTISGGSGGVSVAQNIRLDRGPVSLILGLGT